VIYDVTVQCEAGCHRDEKAVITGDAKPLFDLADVDLDEWLGVNSGVGMVAMLQAALARVVENYAEAVSLELEDMEFAPDIVVGFLIVIRDSVLAHANMGIASTVTVAGQ
jgi:hypothetical protein